MLIKLTAFISLFILLSDLSSCEKVVVAQDGSGDFTLIQDALNSIPVGTKERFIIYIKNGIYNEKIFIEKNNVALMGEDKEQTKIVYSELRKNWRKK